MKLKRLLAILLGISFLISCIGVQASFAGGGGKGFAGALESTQWASWATALQNHIDMITSLGDIFRSIGVIAVYFPKK